MSSINDHERNAPLEMTAEQFRTTGHDLIDQIADFLDGLRQRPVTPGEPPSRIREVVGDRGLPTQGTPTEEVIRGVPDMMFDHSLFNGHPRFWGYITSSAAPIGALADMLAAAVNPNVGGAVLSPLACEIEAQTIRWLAELLGYPVSCGGILVSGGNMANFVGFLAGRQAKAPWDIKTRGVVDHGRHLITYVSAETHTWIDKAAELFGQGRESVRWIPVDDDLRMRVDLLREQIEQDRSDGHVPIMVVGAAGTVGTGVVDPLPEIAQVCREYDLWFHVDGAYGAPAMLSADAPPELLAMRDADSIAMDPHKWLYAPLEAGCTLVRDPNHLLGAFSHHPVYYKFDGMSDQPAINFYEFGLQNSRGFRALKVWLGLQQAGREGMAQMVSDDIRLSRLMHESVAAHPELEAWTQHLSISTFRYVPPEITPGSSEAEAYLNTLNEQVLEHLQAGGEVFVSNHVIRDRYLLRACIVNFRTTEADVRALPEIVARVGREVHAAMR